MRRQATIGAMLGAGLLVLVAGPEAGSRGWVVPLKSSVSVRGGPGAALSARPQAEIAGPANGIYCGSVVENGVGVHDLGGFPAGLHMIVTVESFSDGFNPAAAVLVATVGEKAANNVRVAYFYDNDSGGDNDAKVDFVTPQAGTYVLIVNDYADAMVGCYRYQLVVE
jgi:hypothetical protein